jgi:hypothetical protein
MATVESIVRDVIAGVDSDGAFLNCVRWINYRYEELVARVKFRHLRKIGEIQVLATYDTGTIAATRDSTAVVGTDTLWETLMGSGTQEYWYLRNNNAWYKIASVTDETNLVLTTAFSEDTVTTGTYSIVKRYYPLDSTSRWVTSFVHTRLRREMDLMAMESLDSKAPGRTLVTSFPTTAAQLGVDSNGSLLFEFYPYSTESEILHYVYYELPTALTLSSTIPPQIDATVLKEGVLIDLYRYLKAEMRNKGRIDEANSWGNDEQRQQTRWEKYIQQASRTSRGVDDLAFVLKKYGTGYPLRDITTAREEVLMRWPG